MTNTRTDSTQQKADEVSAWSLIKPYWVSEERGFAWGLLVAIIAINMTVVWINVRLNSWNADFYNALQNKNVKDFPHLLLIFTGLAFAYILLAVYGRYLRQMLAFRWRQWLTNRFLEQWLGDKAFYRIERDRLADNPDQRISDDLQSFATTTLSLSLDLLSTLVTLVTFITILWTHRGRADLLARRHADHDSGLHGVGRRALRDSRLADHPEGRPSARVDQLSAAESGSGFPLRADSRARKRRADRVLRRHLHRDTPTPRPSSSAFATTGGCIMKYTKRMTFVLSFYGQIAIIFPIMVAAPRYFAGAFSFGVLMQISSAFGTVSDSFSWFINSYSTLVEWRATVNRLREFKRVMRSTHIREESSPATEHGGINLHYTSTPSLTTNGLMLALPNGTPLVARARTSSIEPGSRWLVRRAVRARARAR